MRTYIILIIGLFSINSFAQTATDEKKVVENKSTVEIIKVKKEEETLVKEEQVPEVFTVVEEMPSFPGGETEKTKFIQSNIKFPDSAIKKQIMGKCFLKFTITKDGSITDVVVLKGVADCTECDEEAKRVVSSMPKWKPGKQNGRAVATYYNLPINFQYK